MTDPLDLPSGVGVEEWNPAEPWMKHIREMTFRELKARCESNLHAWDRYTPGQRLQMQRANDPHYANEIIRKKRRAAHAD